jgi:hypothetical protein
MIEMDRHQIMSELQNLERNQEEMMRIQRENHLSLDQAMASIKRQLKKINQPTTTSAAPQVRKQLVVYISNTSKRSHLLKFGPANWKWKGL